MPAMINVIRPSRILLSSSEWVSVATHTQGTDQLLIHHTGTDNGNGDDLAVTATILPIQ